MSTQLKISLQLVAVFSLAALALFHMDQQLLHSGMIAGGKRLPYALLSALTMGLLFIVVFLLFNGYRQSQAAAIHAVEQELESANASLTVTTHDLEERVERRTFEISVANASLNREIAERIQAEAETKKIKHQMELILDSAGEGIFGLDAEGNVTFVNKAASIMLGWAPADLIGKSHHDLVHHSHTNGTPYPVDECPIHQAYQDGKVHFGSDELFWTKDGVGFPVEYISTPIIENKIFTGAVVVFRDLTTFR
ncbi:PAS domain-containing protein [Desulfogranum mediterraneum]|uniref:PAS domain-containing protein n=1 Tax=Desulfogranum mediterraneum TaxID=160661 RepID=UPI000401EA08|nr:PAS domain-containing protein [Desulfogranum mediterraneum]